MVDVNNFRLVVLATLLAAAFSLTDRNMTGFSEKVLSLFLLILLVF